MRGFLGPQGLLETFWENIPKGTFPKISQKALSLFTTTFFSVRSNWKYLCGLRTFPVTPKIIFNSFWNNSSLVISSAKSIWSGSGSSGTFPFFLPKNSQKFPEWFWHPPRIIRHVPKPIWLNGISRNNFSVLPKLFRCSLSGTFPVCPKLFRQISLRLPV